MLFRPLQTAQDKTSPSNLISDLKRHSIPGSESRIMAIRQWVDRNIYFSTQIISEKIEVHRIIDQIRKESCKKYL